MNLFSDLMSLKSALESENVQSIWSAFKKIGDDIAGPQMMGALHHTDEAEKVKVKGCCDDIEKKCHEMMSVHGGEVGKFGGGAFLKLLLPIILQFLPLLFQTPDQQPTPTT